MASRMMAVAAGIMVAICVTDHAHAYETPTHAEISQQAINRSVLALEPDLLTNIGLAGGLDVPLFPGEIPADQKNPMPDPTVFLQRVSIRRLIQSGAVLEDRSLNSLHHFYDPMNNNSGLTLGQGLLSMHAGLASPDWMLETGGVNLTNVLVQKFSYIDSLNYFYRALVAQQFQERNLNWGLMFRGIGHLIHHIQDMAQPQHVRNDQHCDGTVTQGCLFMSNPSHFEKYTDLKRTRIIAAAGVYPVPDFPLLRQFWDNLSGTGLAGFVQSNFVSQGTNFEFNDRGQLVTTAKYPLPEPDLAGAKSPEPLATVLELSLVSADEAGRIMQGLDCDIPKVCMMQFIPSRVVDNTAGQGISINPRASSISLLNDELQDDEVPPAAVTTYNRLNFHAAYPYLISRAIAYSTGMINHFFRGRLMIRDAFAEPGGDAQITVLNNSRPGIIFNSGRFELFYESLQNRRKPVPGFSIKSGGLPWAPGSAVQITMTMPDDVNPNYERPFLFVFNALAGRIGAEPGIAAVDFDVSVTGRVERLSQGASECPNRTYGVSIIFNRQPPGKGQILLQGELSRAVFDFSSFVSGFNYKRGNAVWRHLFDTEMDVYRYEVTYRYPDSEADPCTSPGLGGWIEGERVKVIRR